MSGLLVQNDKGLYCSIADVYIDPWKSVKKALITHGHSDHARNGHREYLCVNESVGILKTRLKAKNINGISFGESININGVRFSFHPAGHIVGSAQIRVEHKGEIWVVSGDYKTEKDSIAGEFEPIPCHTFITESTFGLPIFNWKPQELIFEEINNWWSEESSKGHTCVLLAYSLGKAQRLISGLNSSIGKIFTHPTIEKMNCAIRGSGIDLPQTTELNEQTNSTLLKGSIVISPSASIDIEGIEKDKIIVGAASGWMNLKRMRGWRSVDKAFVLSDHADWQGLLSAIESTEAENVLVTHGYTHQFSKYLSQIGYNASVLKTKYEGESVENKLEEDEGV